MKTRRSTPYSIVDNVTGAPNIIAPALGKENVINKNTIISSFFQKLQLFLQIKFIASCLIVSNSNKYNFAHMACSQTHRISFRNLSSAKEKLCSRISIRE